MKKILWMFLALWMVLCVGSVGLAEQAQAPAPEYRTIEGTIVDVRAFYDSEGNVVEGKSFVRITAQEGGLADFYIEAGLCTLSGKALSEAAAGDAFSGTFNASLPMTMIYPPQYTAVSVTIG